MSSLLKLLIILAGLIVCLFLGSGSLLFLWLIATVGIIFIPSSQPTHDISNDKAALTALSTELATEIENESNPDIRKGLERALEKVSARAFLQNATPEAVYYGEPMISPPTTAYGPPMVAPAIATETPPTYEASAAYVASPPPAPASVFKPVDQTVALLYVGAFLFIAAASLFLAYGGISDNFKVITILLCVAAFYGAGIYLSRLNGRLRPAAVTFLSIGLLLLPISGVALYTLLGVDARLVWFLTSVVSLGLYVYAYTIVRHQLIIYLTLGMWLSLVTSAAGIVDVPAYGIIWALIVGSIILQAAERWLVAKDAAIKQPIQYSGVIAVSAAAIGGLLFVNNGVSLWQCGVSLILSAWYVLTIRRDAALEQRDTLAAAAHCLALAGLFAVLYDVLSYETFGQTLIVVSIAHAALFYLLPYKRTLYAKLLYALAITIGAAIPLLLFSFEDSSAIAMLSLICVSLFLMVVKQHISSIIVSAAAITLLPLFVIRIIGMFDYTALPSLAVLFLVVGSLLFAIRYAFYAHYDVAMIYAAAYASAFSASYVVALISGEASLIAVLSAVLAIITVLLALYERQPHLSLLAPVLIASSAGGVLASTGVAWASLSGITTMTLSGAITAFGIRVWKYNDQRYSTPQALMTITMLTIAWSALTLRAGTSWIAPAILACLSIVLLFESKVRSLSRSYTAMSGLVLLLSVLQLHSIYVPVTNWIFYILIVALYFAMMSIWLVRHDDNNAQTMGAVGIALVIFGAFIGIVAPSLLPNGLLYRELLPISIFSITVIYAAIRYKFSDQQSLSVSPFVAGYQILVLVSWLAWVNIFVQIDIQVAASVIAAIVFAFISWYEKGQLQCVAASLIAWLAVYWGCDLFITVAASDQIVIASALMTALSYIVALILRPYTSWHQLLMALAGVYALIGWLMPGTTALPAYVQPFIAVFGAGAILSESRRLQLDLYSKLVCIAIITIAGQQLLYHYLPGSSWLIYTHMWAIYLAYVAWKLRGNGERDLARSVLYSALSVFTLPLVYEALRAPEAYSLLLLVEHATLIILGVLLQKKLLVYWGVAITILSTMYMLRSFAYVQIGIIAILLIGYGLYRLSASEKKI